MPIIAYRVETTEPEKSESQMLRLKEYPAMKNIYLAAEDLDNYGFDVINEESGNTLYINRNPSKAIGMMDGELVNSRVRTERVSPLYPAKKHVMMNGVEVFSYSMENKTLIPMTELAPYHMRLYNVYHTIDAYRLDILKKDLDDAYDALEKKEEYNLASNPQFLPFHPGSNVNMGRIKGGFTNGMANGVSGVTISGGLNLEFNTCFIGIYENNIVNGPGILTQDYFGGKGTQAYNSYYTYERGNFVNNSFSDGIYYKSPCRVGDSSTSNWRPVDGIRIEGDMQNGYRRESAILNDGNNNDKIGLRFGYVVQCEGTVKDGEYCGYFRKYDESGKLIFEGQYSDYISRR